MYSIVGSMLLGFFTYTHAHCLLSEQMLCAELPNKYSFNVFLNINLCFGLPEYAQEDYSRHVGKKDFIMDIYDEYFMGDCS